MAAMDILAGEPLGLWPVHCLSTYAKDEQHHGYGGDELPTGAQI